MKIRIYSDLHLEFLKRDPVLDLPPVDLVILAGDIDIDTRGIQWAKETFKDQPVAYVMGNHEYYEGDLVYTLERAREEASGSNVHLLERDVLELPNATVIGCTLWTDFLFNGEDDENTAKHFSKRYMNDYRYIKNGGKELHPDDTQRISRANYRWLNETISAATKPMIAVTHHGPSHLTRDPHAVMDQFTPAYVSSYEDLLRPPVKLWVTGHTHHCNDVVHNGVRLITHQKGYPSRPVEDFDWDEVFDVAI